jgi:hypothetical protein
MGHQQGRHPGFIHANAHAVAGYARLRHFEYRVANAVSIANADLVIKKPVNREVLSELAEDKIIPSENTFPVVVGVHLINENRALLSAVTGEIGLRIAIDIELAHHSPSRDGRLPNRRAHTLTFPCHITGETDIY